MFRKCHVFFAAVVYFHAIINIKSHIFGAFPMNNMSYDNIAVSDLVLHKIFTSALFIKEPKLKKKT